MNTLFRFSGAVFLAFCLNLLAFHASSTARTILGTTGAGSYSQTSALVEVNPETGELVRVIGEVGYLVNGLAYDITTNKLFASTSRNDPNFTGLIEIDMVSGQGAEVGPNDWGFQPSNVPVAINSLTINSGGQIYGWKEYDDRLVVIDKTEGTATLFGASGVSTMTIGLAFDNSDTLYLVNDNERGDIYTINPATGSATYMDTLGQMAHHGVFDLDTNLYYGIGNGEPWEPASSRSLLVINLETATVVDDLPTVKKLHTLAFVPVRGDIDGDELVTESDLSLLLSHLGQPTSNCPICDLNTDGMIDILDVRILVAENPSLARERKRRRILRRLSRNRGQRR